MTITAGLPPGTAKWRTLAEMGPADLEFPDASAYGAESLVGARVEVGRQVTGIAECPVHALDEVLPGLAVVRDHLTGDDLGQEPAQFIPEGPIVLGQFDAGEVHRPSVTVWPSFVKLVGAAPGRPRAPR